MTLAFLQLVENMAIKTFGSTLTFAFVVVIVFLLLFMFAGIDFRLSGLFTMPVIIGMGELGWLPQMVVGLAWVILVGFGLFLVWNFIRER